MNFEYRFSRMCRGAWERSQLTCQLARTSGRKEGVEAEAVGEEIQDEALLLLLCVATFGVSGAGLPALGNVFISGWIFRIFMPPL